MYSEFLWTITHKQLEFPAQTLQLTLSPDSRSKTNFSFQFIASYVWYSLENLAGDLLLGLTFVVKLPILPTLQVGRIKVRILRLKGLRTNAGFHNKLSIFVPMQRIFLLLLLCGHIINIVKFSQPIICLGDFIIVTLKVAYLIHFFKINFHII